MSSLRVLGDLRQRPGPRVQRFVLVSLGCVLLLYAGYAWILCAFLLRAPLVDLDRTVDADDLTVFQLPDTGHFEGLLLEGTDRKLTYTLPSFVNRNSLDSLEVFTAPGPQNEKGIQPITIIQGDVQNRVQTHRTRIPWEPNPDGTSSIVIEAPNATPEEPLLVSIRTHGASPWTFTFLLTAAGFCILLLARHINPNAPPLSLLTPLILLAFTMLLFWSGGLISIDYFGHGHGRLSGMAIRLGEALQVGHFNEIQYRPTTFSLPALFAFALEGSDATTREIVHVYPVTRYITTVFFFLGFGFLAQTWTKTLGKDSGYILALLLGSFYPFLHDAFFPDVDALLIPLGAALTALIIRWAKGSEKLATPSVLAASLLIIYAFSLKTSSLAFVPMLAAFLFFQYSQTPLLRRSLLTIGVAATLLVVYLTSSNLGQAFQHPDRHVGVANLDFQNTQLWHVVWGAYGHFDRSSDFGFTSSGQRRNDIVAEELGVRSDLYLRQSQAATDHVYKPGVINALKETPSFFLSTAWHRFEKHALRLYRYTAGSGGLVTPWTKNVEGRVDYLNGRASSQPNLIQESTRLDRYWRIAPTVTLTRLQQGTLSKSGDVLLLALAFIGIALVPLSGVRAYLMTGGLLQILMISTVHVLYRYGAFLSVMILLGLTWALTLLWRKLSNPPDGQSAIRTDQTPNM